MTKKTVQFIFLALTIIMLQGQNSWALFEAKVGYGTLISKTDLSSFYSGSSSDIPAAVPTGGLTLDARVIVPVLGLGVGIRNESQKISYSSSLLGIDNSFQRTSLVLNYRILDTLLYLGPIVTVGMNHSNKIKLESNGQPLSEISSSSVSSNSIGFEVGGSFLGIMAGAEAGYMTMKYKDATDSLNTTQKYNLDQSGTYAKVFVGFGI